MATDAELLAQAAVIKNETTPGANTATRVGEMLEAIIESKPNVSRVIQHMGNWDPSGDDMLPNGAIGSGESGAIEAYNRWKITGISSNTDIYFAGAALPIGSFIEAAIDDPDPEDPADWNAYYGIV